MSTAHFLEITETVAIVGVILDALVTFVPTVEGREGSDFRRTVGDLRAEVRATIDDATLGTRLSECFDAATAIGIGVDSLEQVRLAMLAETPVYPLGISVVCAGIVMAVAQEAIIVSARDFTSRAEAEATLKQMIATFDSVKVDTAEDLDSASYQAVTALAAAFINHLYAEELKLPQYVTYSRGVLPSLYMANYIYGDATRSDELIEENDVVHPAFMPSTIQALSE